MEIGYDMVGSLFGREYDLSSGAGEPLDEAEDYVRELLEKLDGIERAVNTVKNEISELCEEEEDRRRWRLNTQRMNLLGGLSRRLGGNYSNAFCKFYQILTRFPELIRPAEAARMKSKIFRSFHMCEIPGHFLSAIDTFIQFFHPNLRWRWKANSLNPHYDFTKASDMFIEDELIINFPNRWIFGSNNSGDVTKLGWTLRQLKKRFDLVTADGSTYSLDHPEDQETIVWEILRGEVECMVATLKNKGCFVMKIYSSFTLKSVKLFILLTTLFKQVTIYKPPSSKSGNSERYLVCIGYKRRLGENYNRRGAIKVFIEEKGVGKYGCEKILAASRFFSKMQMESMSYNIDLFGWPALTQNQMNIFADRAIERVMREGKMSYVRDNPVDSTIFRPERYPRPWMELFGENHVERLKEMEDEGKAEEFLRARQIRWSMADGGERIEDAETEIEWSPEEMREMCDAKAQVMVPTGINPYTHIVHSMFVDPYLWTALKALCPEAVQDLCPDGPPLSRDDFETFALNLPVDGNGHITFSFDEIRSRVDWMRMLMYMMELVRAGRLVGLTLRFAPPPPGLTPPPRSVPLLMSRFSVSLVCALTMIFYKMRIPHPRNRGEVLIEFKEPNYPQDIPEAFEQNINNIYEKIFFGHTCLSFAPLYFMSELHSFIFFYNNEMIKRVICDVLNQRQ